jgi:hypothetical protein
MVGIAMPPEADNPRLDPNFLGYRPGAVPGRRQQNYPRPLQIALQCHRRAATCLKHLPILPRKVDFSCFGYHPDVESRLTFQGKWLLDRIAYILPKTTGRHLVLLCRSVARSCPVDRVRRIQRSSDTMFRPGSTGCSTPAWNVSRLRLLAKRGNKSSLLFNAELDFHSALY